MSKIRIFYLALLLLSATMVFYGCDGGGDGGGGGGGQAGGGHTISAKGGGDKTKTYDGGDGGYSEIYTYLKGGVLFKKAGAAKTSFNVPNYNAAFTPGTNPLVVSSNTIINSIAAADAEPAAGVAYMVAGDTTIYVSDGDGTKQEAAEEVTSLTVNAGVTLTLGLNYSTGGNTGRDMAYVWFDDDVDIKGTVTTNPVSITPDGVVDLRHGATATDRDRGGLYIGSDGQIFIRSTGKIDMAGDDATAADTRGGDGGYTDFYANNLFENRGSIDASGGNGLGTGVGGDAGVSSAWSNYVYVGVDDSQGGPNGGGGVIVNTGPITANGGNGASGGDTCYVEFYAYSHVYNSGNITANGGTGTNGDGGDADWDIYIYSDYGSIFNKGTISQQGGASTGGTGGSGGYLYFSAADYGYSGDFVNSGKLITSGGDSTSTGNGGYGGDLYIYAYGGIRTSGDITMDGGDCVSASCSAGDGGYLYIETYNVYNYDYDGWTWYGAPREIQISGNISLDGGLATGASAYGGDGGYLYTYQYDQDGVDSDAAIEFLGYSTVDFSGGDGIDYGGDGYEVYMYTYPDYVYGTTYSTSGPIVFEPNFIARGGECAAASCDGGEGMYYLEMIAGDWWTYDDGKTATMTFSGDIDLSGGDCAGSNCSAGSSGGTSDSGLFGANGVLKTGTLLNQGGDCTGSGCTGGDGSYYEFTLISSNGDVVNKGMINTKGGNGYYAGDGSDDWDYHVGMYAGKSVKNSGQIYSPGGNSSDAAGTNGDGGHVDLFGGLGTSNTATINVKAGTGGDDSGVNGEIWIDWVDVTPDDGVL